MADYRSLRENERIKFPRDMNETAITLTRFAVLCQCLFQGSAEAPHPLVERMWHLAVAIQNAAPFISERFHELGSHPHITATYFARIVRAAVQVNVHEFMHTVAIKLVDSVVGVELPVFATLVQDLKRGTFHHSSNWIAVPAAYLDTITSSHGIIVSSTPGGASTVISQASTRTAVSAITTDASATTAASVARVANPNRDPELEAIPLRAGGARQIMREHHPPANDAGNELCVAWWTRGGCFPNCGRRATHQPFASPGERSRLLAHVRQHLEAATEAPIA